MEMNWLLFGKGTFPSTSEKNKHATPLKQKPKRVEEKTLDLFSEESIFENKKTTESNQISRNVDRIVIFYKDGGFNIYEN